jgi:hypothetical protein
VAEPSREQVIFLLFYHKVEILTCLASVGLSHFECESVYILCGLCFFSFLILELTHVGNRLFCRTIGLNGGLERGQRSFGAGVALAGPYRTLLILRLFGLLMHRKRETTVVDVSLLGSPASFRQSLATLALAKGKLKLIVRFLLSLFRIFDVGRRNEGRG